VRGRVAPAAVAQDLVVLVVVPVVRAAGRAVRADPVRKVYFGREFLVNMAPAAVLASVRGDPGARAVTGPWRASVAARQVPPVHRPMSP
jgi:hypothetical protein